MMELIISCTVAKHGEAVEQGAVSNFQIIVCLQQLTFADDNFFPLTFPPYSHATLL